MVMAIYFVLRYSCAYLVTVMMFVVDDGPRHHSSQSHRTFLHAASGSQGFRQTNEIGGKQFEQHWSPEDNLSNVDAFGTLAKDR